MVEVGQLVRPIPRIFLEINCHLPVHLLSLALQTLVHRNLSLAVVGLQSSLLLGGGRV